MMQGLNFLDTKITNFINSIILHNPFFDYFFSFFSLKGNSIFIWVLLIIIALILEERKNPGIQKRDIIFVTTFLLSFFATSMLVTFVLKNIFQRPRPFFPTSNFQLQTANCPKDFSFPSGHASAAFAATTVITAFDKKRKWLYFLVAILISLSRIYLGCHYFFDVVGGGFVGFTISYVILHLLPRFEESI